MSDLAISAQGLSKQYRLGEFEPYRTLREAIMHSARRFFDRSTPQASRTSEFWALRDVSFDVRTGEVIGIIGRNGAGKSTLLKILSRITEPTAGQATLRGRVGSLLEVGTGFHPELTGRENIFLNGAILGMSRADIRRRFDQIVAFAEVEPFLDTPVKRYSSGMYVRLAFAVAAHLEPEILVIDEVLAVGDAEFQKKCLGKMSGVARDGRTVLFVSHNMAAVESLCSRAILLSGGRVVCDGSVEQAIQQYRDSTSDASYDIDLSAHSHRVVNVHPVLRRLRIVNESGEPASGGVPVGLPVGFEITLASQQPLPGVTVGIHLYNAFGSRVLSFHSRYQSREAITVHGEARLRCRADSCLLMPGRYSVVLAVSAGEKTVDRIEPCVSFDVVERDVFGTGRLPPTRDGVFVCPAIWSVQQGT